MAVAGAGNWRPPSRGASAPQNQQQPAQGDSRFENQAKQTLGSRPILGMPAAANYKPEARVGPLSPAPTPQARPMWGNMQPAVDAVGRAASSAGDWLARDGRAPAPPPRGAPQYRSAGQPAGAAPANQPALNSYMANMRSLGIGVPIAAAQAARPAPVPARRQPASAPQQVGGRMGDGNRAPAHRSAPSGRMATNDRGVPSPGTRGLSIIGEPSRYNGPHAPAQYGSMPGPSQTFAPRLITANRTNVSDIQHANNTATPRAPITNVAIEDPFSSAPATAQRAVPAAPLSAAWQGAQTFLNNTRTGVNNFLAANRAPQPASAVAANPAAGGRRGRMQENRE